MPDITITQDVITLTIGDTIVIDNSGGISTTNLSLGTRTATTVPINNSNGTGVTIPAATSSLAGGMAAADKVKLDAVPSDVLSQATADTRYRSASSSIPAADVSGTFQDSQIPGSIARDSEVTSAIAAITPASIGAESTAARTLTPTSADPGNTSNINGFLSWLLQAVRGAQVTLSGLGSLATLNSVGNANITDVAASKLTGLLDIARIPTGSTASTVTIGNDARLSDQRVPTDGSVTNAKVAAGAAIDWSKISKVGAVATDVGALSQTAGDARYRPQSAAITSADIQDGTITNIDISGTAAIALSKLATDPLARANHTGSQAISTVTGLQTALDGKQNTSTILDALVSGFTGATNGQVPAKNGSTVTWSTVSGGSGGRPLATSQPIFYVSPSGSNSNDGLTVGTAFLTLPRAIDALTAIDCNGFDPVINLAAGNYDGLVTLKNVVGVANRVTIQGVNGTRTACKIRGTTTTAGGHSVIASSATPYRFKDVEIGISNNTADLYRKLILVQCPLLEFEDVCLRGTTTTDDFISAYSRSTIRFIGSLQVEGSARWFLDINGGFVYYTDNFAFSGNSSFTVFAHGSDFTVVCYASTIAGTHTGKRFEIIDGVLETYGAGDGLPGSTAGTNTYPGLSGGGGGGSTDLSIGTRTSTALEILSSSGADVTLPAATTTLSGLLTGSDKARLDGIATGATANSPDATLLDRANHTGTQAVGTITGLGALATLSTVGTAQITDNAVTSAKMAQVPANTIRGNNTGAIANTLDLTPTQVTAMLDLASGSNKGLISSSDFTKLSGIESGAINQTSVVNLILTGLGDHTEDSDPHSIYRLKSVNIPASEISGTLQDSQIPSSVARDTEVVAAITAHEVAFNHATFATTTQLTNLRNEVGMIGTAFTNTSAANAAAVITISAPGAGQCLQLNQLTFSYSGAPTNGLLTIQQGSTIIHETAITAAGAGPLVGGYKLGANTAMTITLAAGGSGVVGRISASVSTVPV